MPHLKIIFMGTPDFAVPSLEKLVRSDHQVVGVYTQPPRPAGRHYRVHKSPIHELAEQNHIPVFTPKTFQDPEAGKIFQSLGADVAVVVAYGLILPANTLKAPRLGCINVHASLLPRWRGAAPIQHAILAGDLETGVTIMAMDEGLDTGPLLAQRSIPLTSTTTAPSLQDTLARQGAELLLPTLEDYAAKRLTPTPQPVAGITYAPKLTRMEAQLNWLLSAEQLERQIRAFTPWPGTWFLQGETLLKVLEAETISLTANAPAGTIVDAYLTIQCGHHALRILKIQRPGSRPMSTAEFLRGYSLPPGIQLTTLPF